MSNWKKVRLGDVCVIKHGYAFKGEDFSDSPTSYILTTPGNFKIGGGFKCDKPKYYNGEIPNGYVLQKDDVIVTMTDLSKAGDTLGYSALVPNNNGIIYLHNQRVGLVNITSNDVDKLFLYWLLRTRNYQQYVVGSASGSTVKHTSPKSILNYTFLLPPIEEQRRIAGILGALDDKIECNNRINRNLEEQAAALFRRWFVDFEFPDANGKPYRSSGGPMTPSPLGPIPKGWQVGTLGDIAKITSGKRPLDKSNTKTTKFSIPLIGASSVMGYTSCVLYDNKILAIGRVGTHGIVQRIDYECWTSDNTLVITSDNYEYVYQLLYRIDYKSINRGSTQPLITQTDINNFEILIPTFEVLAKYEKGCSYLMNSNLQKENQTLEELRASILPKLMNNEI